MADKRCDNGHFIDESWDLCPYCPQEQGESEVPVVRPRSLAMEAPPTEPAASAASAPTTPDFREKDVGQKAVPPARATSSLAAVPTPPMERTVAVAQVNTTKRYVVAWLVGLNGVTRGESFAVRMGRNVIGRDRRSDVVIHDDQASSHHADLVFRPEEKRFILMDHNSTNGTYVNEMEIEPRRDLAARDVIRIGLQRFLFTPLCQEGFHWDDEGLLK